MKMSLVGATPQGFLYVKEKSRFYAALSSSFFVFRFYRDDR